MGTVFDRIQDALKEGDCTRDEIIRYFDRHGGNSKSVYRTLKEEVEKSGSMAVLTVEPSPAETQEIFVLWSDALEILFRKIESSTSMFVSPELGSTDSGEGVTNITLDIKSPGDFVGGIAWIALVSCQADAKRPERFVLQEPVNLRAYEYAKLQFQVFRGSGQRTLVFNRESYNPPYPLNVVFFELVLKEAFLLYPFFLNVHLSREVRPLRVVSCRWKDWTIAFDTHTLGWNRTPSETD